MTTGSDIAGASSTAHRALTTVSEKHRPFMGLGGISERLLCTRPRPQMPPDDSTTSKRKDAHLDLCATEEVAPPQNSTLLDCVKLMHSAMPELQLSDVGLSTRLFGKTLKAPLLITGMTGGSDRAGEVNRDLATAAEACGVAFGVGSQRAMGELPALSKTYAVRDVAPRTVIIGNIGLRQAAAMGIDKVRGIADAIHADAMALHLNPGQE